MNKKLAIAKRLAVAILFGGLFISPITSAGPFPDGPGVDAAPSLGKFVVTFSFKFVKKLHTGKLGSYLKPQTVSILKTVLCSGSNWDTSPETPRCVRKDRTIISPLLSESKTRVGRSEPHLDGSDADLNGTLVCEKGVIDECEEFFSNMISDLDFQNNLSNPKMYSFPADSSGETGDGPEGTQEVHTQMLSLNMKKGANAVRAGSKLSAEHFDLRSIGEVQSLSPPGSEGGFPAESFFQLYAEMDLDMNTDGQIDMTLFNKSGNPLIVHGTGLDKFPPKLIYTHTPTVWATSLRLQTQEGKDEYPYSVGQVRMAGHGINYQCAGIDGCNTRKGVRDGEKSDMEMFNEVFETLPLAPINPVVPDDDDGYEPEPPACQLYAVQDHGRNNSQFFSIFTDNLEVITVSKVLPGLDIESLAAHPTHDMLYAASGDATKRPGFLYSFNPDIGEVVEIGETGFGDVPSLAFHPDSTLWGWAKGDGLITIDIKTGKGTLEKAFPDALVEGISWNPAGTHIYATENTNLWVYEYATQTVNLACSNLPGETEALEILPDGALLLGIHGEEKIIQFQAFNPETCEIVFGVDIPTSPTINDVEGIAWPINLCSQP